MGLGGWETARSRGARRVIWNPFRLHDDDDDDKGGLVKM